VAEPSSTIPYIQQSPEVQINLESPVEEDDEDADVEEEPSGKPKRKK